MANRDKNVHKFKRKPAKQDKYTLDKQEKKAHYKARKQRKQRNQLWAS